MLFGAPPDWTLRSFLSSIDHLRLDRIRVRGFGPTLFNTMERVRGHQPLLELLDRYRRGLVARAPSSTRPRLAQALQDAQRRFVGVVPLLVSADVSDAQRRAVLAVTWNVIALNVSALCCGVPVPPVGWACWQSLGACHPVTGLDPKDAGEDEPRSMLQREIRVDVGLIDPRGVAELVGAEVEAAQVEPASEGVQLRLVTARRGMWTVGPHGHGLAPVLWDRGLARPTRARGARELGRLGRIVTSWAPMAAGYDEVRFRFADRRVLSVRRQIWVEPRTTVVRFVPPSGRGARARGGPGTASECGGGVGAHGRALRRAS